jgi:UDP:flavonoid glycosyltransferase YjiC (YdhE family)
VRVLFASTQGAGHYNPLIPFVEAARRRGHEVLVVVPPALADTVEAAGYEARIGADPPEAELGAVWGRVQEASPDEANRLVIGDIFARLDTQTMLPTLRDACRDWNPDVVLREPSEFASAVAADELGVAQARITVGLADTEALALGIAEPVLEGLRPGVTARISASAFLTLLPEDVDPGRFQRTLRFSEPARTGEPLPGWWGDDGRPLVYVSFGSVAGGLPLAAAAYRAALDAVAELPVRVLLTIGRRADPSLLGTLPHNVHVEAWVPQRDVLAHATAVVGHGGYGTTLGTLAAGLPSVLVPLFADQPFNARRVEEVGAGLSVPAEADAIRSALEKVLADTSFRNAAAGIAAEMRGLPPVDEAFEFVAG